MAGACELIVVPAATAPEELPPPPHDPDVAKLGRRSRPRPWLQVAGARILSLAAQAAVTAVSLLFAAASAMFLVVLIAAAAAFGHRRGSRYCVPSHDPSPPRPLRKGLSASDLRRLPSFAFASSTGERDGDGDGRETSSSCAVCLEAARAGERWCWMPACRHSFHAACVDRWLARSPVCPVCRAAVSVSTS